jgi:hypothetical protein
MLRREEGNRGTERTKRFPSLVFSLPFLAVFFFSVLAAPAARAALVVFEDGRTMRVAAFEVVDEDRLSLSLTGGGTMTIPLDVVDRIVDEEYERVEPPGADVLGAELPPMLARSIRIFSESPLGRPVIGSPFDKDIFDAAKKHRIDPALIAAVIKVESNWAPRAVSRKGARGLMQLMPATARRLGVRSTFDPRDNIQGGAAYLAELAERFGESSVELILAAYNAGERAVEEHGGVPPYRETREYVRRVTAVWKSAL